MQKKTLIKQIKLHHMELLQEKQIYCSFQSTGVMALLKTENRNDSTEIIMVGSTEVVFPLPPIDIQWIINFGIHLNDRKNSTKKCANK